MKKNIYQQVVEKPRLFQQQSDEYEDSRAKADAMRNEVRFRQYMDRAYMDLEKTNQQLQRTRADLQNTSKQINEKDVVLYQLQEQLVLQQSKYENLLNEAHQTHDKQLVEKGNFLKIKNDEILQQKEIDFQKRLEQQVQAKIKERKITAEQLDNQLTPRAQRKVFQKQYQVLLEKQNQLLETRNQQKFPQQSVDVMKIINDKIQNNQYEYQIETTYIEQEQKFDFLDSDKAELPETVLNYYFVKDMELHIDQQEEVIQQITNINADTELDAYFKQDNDENHNRQNSNAKDLSGIATGEDSDGGLEYSEIAHK